MAVQTPPPQPTPALPEIRDIAPPVDVFPWPPWMVAIGVLLLLLLLLLLVWFIARAIRRHAPSPLTPRAVALRDLETLRNDVNRLDPYAFSVRVSDVLRGFVGAQFGLRAKEQTSPEFLASIAGAPQFGDDDRALLARFLEKCDLIKFAHIDASSADSAELIGSAMAFVQGGRA
ncbi:MAG: DUF4381 family protein [Chthoniobacteraceae bacterium]